MTLQKIEILRLLILQLIICALLVTYGLFKKKKKKKVRVTQYRYGSEI